MSKIPENVDFILRSRINLHYYDNAVILENQFSSHVIITNPFSESHYGSKLSLTSFRGDLYNSGYMVTREQQIPIHGCLGVIRLLTGWFIVVFTERQLVGTIQGSEVYLITKCSVFSIPGSQRDLSEEEKNVQKNYLTGLNNLLQTSGFYYSQAFDIFTNYQKKRTLSEDILKEPLWKRIDERFFWNRYLLQQFIDNNLNDWIIPVVDGFMRIEPSNINGCLFDYILISRRDCLRTGARFLTRGADIKGNVANFVETEQIVIFNGVISSWVETRGTIPLIWTQNGKSLKSKPEVSISPFLRNAFQSHISKHLQVYGTLVIVSLIDQRGHEQEIGEMYETLVRLYEFQDVKYVAYDFHEQCKNNNYANLDRLVEYLTDEMMRMSYYAQDPLGQPLNFQKGVVRTNCIDCLDRTGVVQSKLARYMLAVQLTAIGIFLPNDSIENHLNFQAMLNNLWTDNADTMSKRYTGVGALKTDFTRTGKRSATGAVADGMKSVSRLYQSAFNDDEKQISLDLFLGITILERQSKYLSQQTEHSAPTFRFKTMMMNQEGKGEYAMIELVENYDQMTIYNIESCSSQFFNIFSIVQIEKSSSNYNLLTIVFNCVPFPKRISFSSTEKKEKFLYVFEQVKKSCTNAHLYQQNNFQQSLQSVTQNLIDLNFDQTGELPPPIIPISSDPLIPSSLPSSQPPPLPSTPSSIPPPLPANRPSLQTVEENISIYIGSCNMTAVNWEVYPSFADCIPGGQDIYVISTQNYQTQAPPGYYFSGVIYWLLSLQLYFGPSYEVVQHSVCNKVALIILARKDIIWKISNITKSYVTVVEPVKIVAQSDSQVILNTTAKGIGNFFKAISKEVQKNLSESNNSSTPRPSKSANGTILKDPSEFIGVAIGFQYNESSLCFIACKRFNNIYRVLDMDVYNGFHQVFFVGDAPPELMQSKGRRWGQLTGQGQYGSIYLRSLNDNNLQNILAPRELNPNWALPLSVCFSLPTLLPLQYNNSSNPIVISLSDLRGNELYIGDRIFDPYLLVHSSILAKAMRTNSKRRTWNPEWNELLVLKPIFDNLNMLEKRHLTLEVLDQEEGIVIGVGTIWLRDAFIARGELVEFKAAITSFEESRGYVTGKIAIRTG